MRLFTCTKLTVRIQALPTCHLQHEQARYHRQWDIDHLHLMNDDVGHPAPIRETRSHGREACQSHPQWRRIDEITESASRANEPSGPSLRIAGDESAARTAKSVTSARRRGSGMVGDRQRRNEGWTSLTSLM